MTLTLRARLATISTIVFGLSLAALSFASYEVLAWSLDDDATQLVNELTNGLHGYLRFNGDTPFLRFNANDAAQAAFVHEATHYYQVFDVATGRLLGRSSVAPFSLDLTPAQVQQLHAAPKATDIETDHGRMRFSSSVGRRPDRQEYLLQVGVSLAPMDTALEHYRQLLWWRVPFGLGVAGLISWWLSGFALAPLSVLAAAARHIDVNTLDRRLPVRPVNDELNGVATAFNETLDRLQHAIGEMRQFSAALAHELRTPLAALRGEIELALRMPETSDLQQRAFVSQIEEVDRLTRLINHILTLARAESGQIQLASAPVNLGDLAASVVEQLEPMAQARSIDLRCEQTAVVVQGDAGWLQRMLLNLLDNALKFTNENGRIVVRVSRQGNKARIEVQDTGIGLSPEDAQQVFERFFRADRARSRTSDGAGLGLSLVQWIAEHHHGVVFVRSQLGEGTTFTVTLPLAPA